jgi:transcriptional antiterminator RfaH
MTHAEAGSSLPAGQPAWFCLRSQPKHEHIAAASLRQAPGLDVFLPRLRFKRATRQGRVWVTEALFPSYLFARFDLQSCLRLVQHARGLRGVVHFGSRWPTIPDQVVEELRARLSDQVHLLIPEAKPGDEVQVMTGALQGLRAVIQRVMPGKERVAVLMDFLGRQTSVELESQTLALEQQGRRLAFS